MTPLKIKSLRAALRRFWQQERGAGTPFFVFGMMALLLTGAYALDTMQATGDAAQVKRATDAAALAVGRAALAKNNSEYDSSDLQALAWQYIQSNLGMNTELVQQLSEADVAVSSGRSSKARRTYTVTLNFTTHSTLLHLADKSQSIYSTAEVIYRPTEVALVLPNTSTETSSELAVLRTLGSQFADDFLTGYTDRRLALVPYSQTVNVWDASRWSTRIRSWPMSSALTPVELTSLFASGQGISSLASRLMPDLQTKRECFYRGLNAGENYFWEQAPTGTFHVSYRDDLPENATWMPYISWTGPNPMFGTATGVNATRYIVGDKGCPDAPLLPLTDDLTAIDARLAQMNSQFNVNYAIPMGWAAMALAPAFRGSSGWGDDTWPLDFNDSGSGNIKAIVMLGNTIGDWFDTDAYNAYVGQNIDGVSQAGGEYAAATERFRSLCTSFRNRNMLFYFIGVRPGDPNDFGRTLFGQVAVPGLQACITNNGGSIQFADADSFASGSGQISSDLDDILDDINRQSSSVRLIE